MTDSTTLNDDYLAKIQAMNALVRGWASYYRAVNPSKTFQLLDAYVWLRLRTWLAKKYKISPKQVRQRYMHRQKGPKGPRIAQRDGRRAKPELMSESWSELDVPPVREGRNSEMESKKGRREKELSNSQEKKP